MAKKNRVKTGRVISVSKEDNILLKKIFIACEEIGVDLSNSEICDQIFSTGIHVKYNDLYTNRN